MVRETIIIIALSCVIALLLFGVISMGYYIARCEKKIKRLKTESCVWQDIVKKQNTLLSRYETTEIYIGK